MSSYLKAAVVVAGVLGAIALPGIAAAEWNDEGVEITQEKTVKTTGTVRVGGGLECPSEESELFKPGKKDGLFESLIVENNKGVTNNFDDCKVIGIMAAAGCNKVTGFENTGAPWTTHNTGSAITVTAISIDMHFSGGPFCPPTVKVEGNITKTPDNPNSIHSYSLSGTLASAVGSMAVGGELAVTGSDSGTYGL